MILTHETLSAATRGFKALFKTSFDNTQPFYEQLATKVPSENSSETYGWLDSLPRMREWIGDRELKNLSANGYTISNKSYEATLSVSRDDMEDDRLGLYRPQINMLAEEARLYPDELVSGLILNGKKNLCYDGKPFFSGDHQIGRVSVPNLSHKRLTPESYGAARASMLSIKNSADKTMRIRPSLLVVPPALEGTGRSILYAQQIAGSDNIYYKSAELLVLPELAGQDTSWTLLDTTKAIKPFIVQERRPVEFQTLDKLDDVNVFMRNQFLYGVSWRGNVGYSLWQLAHMSDGTQA